MRIKNLLFVGLAGAAAATMMSVNVLAQNGRSDETPPPPPAGETRPGEMPPGGARPGAGQDEVQITLRPAGDGRFEVYIDGQRVEGRAGERLLRALQDQRGEGARRMAPGEGPPPGERPMRGMRSPQGDVPPGDRPPGPPGMDGPESELMPAFRQRVGQSYDGPVPELTDELLVEVMAVIKDFDEALHTRLSSAMETNPEMVKGRLQGDLRRWMTAVELKRNDPELYTLNVKDRQYTHETSRLLGEYFAARRSGDAAKVESIRGELMTLLGEHFDVRQQLRERDLAQLEQRLEFLRKQVQQRRERREEIIKGHLDQLSGAQGEDF